VAGAIAALFADARAINPAADEYGHARSRAYTDAVALLKASAKVGHTIAELRGNKFEHTINVRRGDAAAPPAHPQNTTEDVPTGVESAYPGRIRLTDGRVCIRASGNRWRIIEDDGEGCSENCHPLCKEWNSAKAENPTPLIDEDDAAAFAAAGPNATPAQREAAAKALEHAVTALDSARSGFGEGTPTPNSGGSNGNFARPEADAGASERVG
jgi:hypothetical protein